MVNSPNLFRISLDTLKQPIFILDPQRSCVFANRAFQEFFAVEAQPSGAIAIDAFWPDVTDADLGVSEFTCELRLARGETFAVKLGVSAMPEEHYLIRVLAGISRNESIHNFHAQRLETLGMLAGGVAHDFNNVLAGILGHTTYLKTILPHKGSHSESLAAIEDGAKKATTIIQQILNFSRLDTAEKSVSINLGELAVKTCNLLRRAISPEYSLEPLVPEKPVQVLAVEGKLAQVIVNLVINARDAINKGRGKIRVGVDKTPSRELLESAFRTKDLACSTYVNLYVEDNGHGMSPEVLARIFEPYFSTKKEKGTGLGLSTVAAIVKSFGGAIDVASEINVGTRVSILLPVIQAQEVAANKPNTDGVPKKLETGTESILIIDDESPVRNVLSVSLQHLGYKVDTASSGVEGLEKYTDGQTQYDLVILDMLMPVLSGEKVFFKLKSIRNDIKVLLVSGYASEEAVNHVLASGGLDFIQKPFTIEELSKRVRACLENRVLSRQPVMK